MKYLDIHFCGTMETYSYGTYLGEKSLDDVLANALIKGGMNGYKGIVRLHLAIEPIKDEGLKVEVEE